MSKNYTDLLKARLDEGNFQKLIALENPDLIDFLGEYVELCNPESVFIRTDSNQGLNYIKEKSLAQGEEKKLALSGHTIHFDGPLDQARDKKNTKYLVVNPDEQPHLNSVKREAGIEEVRGYLKDIMKDKEMFVSFFCLGPADSQFSILAVQITDSAYLVHAEDLLYRPGYEQFKKNKAGDFFKFVHSAGELENNVSKNVGKKRVYIDLENNIVYSTNTQYAGNAVGLKKLALRLAIKKASNEGWLAEHMFIMGVSDKKSKAYFCGAYPSMCGKTSTAMLNGESIIGDDIAYLRVKGDDVYAVNVERGIFGIIKDVNQEDDPTIFKSLTSEEEIIFSNILVDEAKCPFWIGKSKDTLPKGVNFSGEWFPGKMDKEGKEISPSHKNARYTISLDALENVDENLENPQGIKVSGLIYGGRDSDTWVPVEQALSWQHGIITKAASIESETTAATLGKEGVRVFNPMSNMDFLSIPLSRYIEMNLEFGKKAKNTPPIFSVNYFLRNKQGSFLNAIGDKRIWLRWMKEKAEAGASGLLTPTGVIPKYEDLKALFKEVLNREYTRDNYLEQFTLRIPENLLKIERITNIYKDSKDIPACLFEELEAQKIRLRECQKAHGDYVSPLVFKES